MKILVLMTMYRRFKITDAILRNLAIIRDKLKGEIDINVLVAGSEGMHSRNIVLKHGFKYSEQPNSPLGQKWNKILKISKQFDYTHLMILGSDDLVSEETFRLYKHYAEFGSVSFKDLFIHDLHSLKTKFLNGYMDSGHKIIGAGFLLRRDIVEKAQFHLWTDYKNKGLDGSMMKYLDTLPVFITRKMIGSEDGAILIDVKNSENIHTYTQIGGIEVDADPFKYFDKEIVDTLNSIR